MRSLPNHFIKAEAVLVETAETAPKFQSDDYLAGLTEEPEAEPEPVPETTASEVPAVQTDEPAEDTTAALEETSDAQEEEQAEELQVALVRCGLRNALNPDPSRSQSSKP